MKKTLSLLMAVLLGCTLMAQGPDDPRHKHHNPPSPPNVEEMVSNLSALQKKRLASVTSEGKTQADKLQAELNAVRKKIRAIMEQDGDQSDKLFPLIDREAALQAKIAKQMYSIRQQIDAILTPEQLAEFRTRLKADRDRRHRGDPAARKTGGRQPKARR